MAGMIAITGWGATYVIYLSPGHKPSMMKTSNGNSNAVADAAKDALLRMRAENGGSIQIAVDHLRQRGLDVLLENVDTTQTAEDIENMQDDGHQLVVRGVSRSLWLQVRSEAVKRGQPSGALLDEIMSEWLRVHA